MKKVILLFCQFLIALSAFCQSDATLEETKEWIIDKVNDILTPYERKVTFYIGDPHLADGSFFNFRAYDAKDAFNLEYEYKKVYEKGTLGEASSIFAITKGNNINSLEK